MPHLSRASLRTLPRIVAVVGLAAIALVTGLVAYLQISMGRTQIFAAAEKFNETLTVALARVVSSTLTEALALERATGGINPETRRALDTTFAAMGDGSRVLKVKLYNLAGATIYSTNPAEVGQSKYDNPSFRQARQGIVSTGHDFRASFRGIARTYHDRNVAFTYLPLRADAGRQIGVVEIYADITDEIAGSNRSVIVVLAILLPCLFAFYAILLVMVTRHARAIGAAHARHLDLAAEAARANAASDAKTHFLMTVSHELRTPLNAIIGFSEMIKEQRLGPISNARYASYAGDIHGAGTHLLSLINEILDATALHQRRMPMALAPADCAALAREVFETLRPLAQQRGQSLAFSCRERPPSCKTDARRFRQILYNLAGNAVKYAGAGRTIEISLDVDRAAARLRLVVADNGPGIAPEDLQKCLAPFGQARGWAVSGQGLGLGLSLTKALAESLGGALELASTVGQGTVATVTLPFEAVAAEAAPADDAMPAPRAALRPA
jgi:cell cycle sensor histidine kinase DivJ